MKSRLMRRKDVLFLPDWREQNPYLNLLASGLRDSGLNVSYADFEPVFFPLFKAFRKHNEIRTLHLHWINALIGPLCWKGSPLKRTIRSIMLRLDIFLVHLFGGRIIWTIHNLFSHESRNHEVERRARRVLFRHVDGVAVHSDGARKRVLAVYGDPGKTEMVIIPHGNYIQSYASSDLRQKSLSFELETREYRTTFLFFGLLREYKGLMDLIAAFRRIEQSDICLIIAGRPDSPEAAAKIEDAVGDDSRIKLSLGFVPDNDVSPLFAISDVVVLPFRRILTSGSAVLSMSMAKAMILPDDAEILGGVCEEGAQFFRKDDIESAIESILDRNMEDMGAHNLQAVVSNTWPEIGRQYRELYLNTARN